MQLKSRILPLAAVVAATVAAGPVLARDWDGGQVDVPPPEAVQTVYLEAEDLLPALESYQAPGVRQPGVAIASRQNVGGTFSGNAGVLLTNGDDGTRMTLRFTVPASGAYNVIARMGVGPDHGIVAPSLDGRPLGGPIDGYAPAAGRSEERVLGRVELAEGDHTITFTVVGMNPAATGRNARVDYFELDP